MFTNKHSYFCADKVYGNIKIANRKAHLKDNDTDSLCEDRAGIVGNVCFVIDGHSGVYTALFYEAYIKSFLESEPMISLTSLIDKLDKQSIVIYRNYNHNIPNIKLILKIKKYCKKKSIKFYLSNDIKLAIKLDLDGAYIPAFNNSFQHLAYSYKKKFKIIGSAHSLREIRTKENQKVIKIFLSSLFKKNKNFLGINKFKLLSKLSKKNVVALGGISSKNYKKLSLLNQSDFAGISYFE